MGVVGGGGQVLHFDVELVLGLDGGEQVGLDITEFTMGGDEGSLLSLNGVLEGGDLSGGVSGETGETTRGDDERRGRPQKGARNADDLLGHDTLAP